MLKYRIISFPLLIALLAGIFFWPAGGPWLFAAAAAVLLPTALYEMGKLAAAIKFPNSPVGLGIAGFISVLLLLLPYRPHFISLREGLILFLIFLLFCFWIAILRQRVEGAKKCAGSFALFFFGWIPLIMLALIYRYVSPRAFAFVVCTTKAMDTGGYIFGMLSSKLPGGNHKIVPAVSPKKSWEGFFGGLLLSLAVGWLFCRFAPLWAPRATMLTAVIFSLGSFLGDLTESSFKRAAGVKDSGRWLPGMGGTLDLVDSFIYNGMIFWLLLPFLKRMM